MKMVGIEKNNREQVKGGERKGIKVKEQENRNKNNES